MTDDMRMVPASELRELRAKAAALDELFRWSNEIGELAFDGAQIRKKIDRAAAKALASYDEREAKAREAQRDREACRRSDIDPRGETGT